MVDKCLICLTNIENSFCFLNCNCRGIYHTNCIDHWLQINRKCPTCNKVFRQFKNSNTKLLEEAMFYESIGRYTIFNKKYLKK